MRDQYSRNRTSFLDKILVYIFMCLMLAGWLTYAVNCIQKGETILMVAGTIIWPFGVFMGILNWFGMGWPM